MSIVSRRKRQEELLTLFKQEEDHYEELHKYDQVYVKMFNGTTKRWQVARFSKESFKKYKQYNRAHQVNRELDNELAERLLKED